MFISDGWKPLIRNIPGCIFWRRFRRFSTFAYDCTLPVSLQNHSETLIHALLIHHFLCFSDVKRFAGSMFSIFFHDVSVYFLSGSQARKVHCMTFGSAVIRTTFSRQDGAEWTKRFSASQNVRKEIACASALYLVGNIVHSFIGKASDVNHWLIDWLMDGLIDWLIDW